MYKKLPGDSLVLNCEALGSPQPSITWLHNGVSVSTSGQFKISSLSESDSGSYSCVASNLVGRVSQEFSVTVESPRVELPVLSGESNITVSEGETAVMQCRVSSTIPVHIKWLRRVESGEEFTVSVADMKLVVVESGEMKLRQGEYISNLVIENVKVDQSGLYVCLATNSAGGFNYRPSALKVMKVLKEENKTFSISTMILALVCGLAAVVLIPLILLIACVVRGRKKDLITMT